MKKKGVMQKWWAKTIVAFLLVFTVVFTLLPFAAKYYLQSWLEANGADKATIQSIRYNPFLSRATVKGMVLQKGDKTLFKESAIVLNVGLTALFTKTIHIEELHYENLFIDIEQGEDNCFRFGTYTTENSSQKDNRVEEEETSVEWSVIADAVTFANCDIKLKTTGVDLLLTIHEAKFLNFSTREEGPGATLYLKGAVNGEELVVELDNFQLTPGIKGGGSLFLKRFSLAEIQKLLPENLKLEGDVGLSGEASFTLDSESDLQVGYDGEISLVKHNLEMDSLTTEGDIHWQGALQYQTEKLELDGTLTGREIEVDLIDAGLLVSQSNIELQLNNSLMLGEMFDFKGKNLLSLKGTTICDKSENLNLLSVDSTVFEDIVSNGAGDHRIGKATFTGLSTEIAGTLPATITIEEAELASFTTKDLKNFQLESVAINTLHGVSQITGATIFHNEVLQAKNIWYGENISVSFAELNVDDLTFLPHISPPPLSLGKGSLNKFQWSNREGLLGDSVFLDDLLVDLKRDEKGNLSVTDDIGKMQKSGIEEKEQEKEGHPKQQTEAKSPIKIGEIVIGGNSNLFFEDRSMALPVRNDLEITRFQIKGIDTTDPEKKTDLEFRGQLAKRAPIDVTGELFFEKEQPDLRLDLSLKNYPLVNLSPYTVQSVGTALGSGQLKLQSGLHLQGGNLDLNNKVILQKLQTETISKELAAELDNKLPISLDAALSLLRDNEDNITLSLPISGSLDDLGVDISDILITALSKAIVPAASGYLVYSLGPYAALAYVGVKVGEKMFQVDLPPIAFDPLETLLEEKSYDLLDRVGTILRDRPKTDLQICPVSSSWEFVSEKEKMAMKEKKLETDEDKRKTLMRIGQQRATAIQAYLSANHNISVSRLLICETKIEKNREAIPSVVMHL